MSAGTSARRSLPSSGSPILLMPRRAVVAWALFWIDFCLGWLRLTCRLTHRVERPGEHAVRSGHLRLQAPVVVGDAWPSRPVPQQRHRAEARTAVHPDRRLGDGARRQHRRRARRRRAGPARPGAPGQGRHRRRPLDPDLPRGHARRRSARAALPGRHGRALSPARRAGRAGGAQFGPVLGAAQIHQMAGGHHVEVLPAIAPGLGREAFMATLRERIEGATARLVAERERRNEQRTVDI